MLYPISQKFALQNFLGFFESYTSSYRHPRYLDWKAVKLS
jgi:hypothetical protein